LLVAAVPLLVAPAIAQVGAPLATPLPAPPMLEGRVLDAETGVPIAGATVSAGQTPPQGARRLRPVPSPMPMGDSRCQ